MRIPQEKKNCGRSLTDTDLCCRCQNTLTGHSGWDWTTSTRVTTGRIRLRLLCLWKDYIYKCIYNLWSVTRRIFHCILSGACFYNAVYVLSCKLWMMMILSIFASSHQFLLLWWRLCQRQRGMKTDLCMGVRARLHFTWSTQIVIRADG